MACQPCRAARTVADEAPAVQESVFCGVCNLASHQKSFTQQLHTVSAAALRAKYLAEMEDALVGEEPGLGPLLSAVDGQQRKTCDSDLGLRPPMPRGPASG